MLVAPRLCLANDQDYYNNDQQEEERYYDNNNDRDNSQERYHQEDNSEYERQEDHYDGNNNQYYEEEHRHENQQHREEEQHHGEHNNNNNQQWDEQQHHEQQHDSTVEQQHQHYDDNHNNNNNYENHDGSYNDQYEHQNENVQNEYRHEENHEYHYQEHYQEEQNEYHYEEHYYSQSSHQYYDDSNQQQEHHSEYTPPVEENRYDNHIEQEQQQEDYHNDDQPVKEQFDQPTHEEQLDDNYQQDQPTTSDEHFDEYQATYDEQARPEEEEAEYQPTYDDGSNAEDQFDDYQPTTSYDEPLQDEYDYYNPPTSTYETTASEQKQPGVDFSWPMHYFYNRHPIPSERGRRARRHLLFMQGCSNHYTIQECQTSDMERMKMNLRQPRVLMNYTAAGYAKMEAPRSIFTMLKHFYNKHHSERQVRENWPPGNIYTNHWASTVKLLPVNGLAHTQGQADPQPSLTQQQRKDIISQVQPILEAWCKMPLIPTSLYGIRTYKRGSILAPHVDRLPLVISAIINVAQEVVEDWPLEIIDHSGHAINVTMKPGDMVLYEGASVIHGRPYPLNGQSYSNLFLHFEPVGYSERHHKSADQKKRRKDPKALFEEALAKQQSATTHESDRWKERQNQRPYYVPAKNEEQWEQRFVYVKRKENKKSKKNSKKTITTTTTTTSSSSTTKNEEWEKDLDERLFHNLAAKGLLLKMKEMVMEDPTIITKTDNNGWLALHEAARAGQTHVVEYLCNLMDQSEINTRTNGGKGATPTWWAMHMFNKDHPTVKALLKHGGKSIAPNS